MYIKHSRSLPIVAIALLFSAPVFAESPALMLADGQPWAATMPNGSTAEITFQPDGSAQAKRGFFRIQMTWTPTDDGMCMAGGPGGNRCMAIVAQPGGYIGMSDDQVVLTLMR
jgi:hypothetical protein